MVGPPRARYPSPQKSYHHAQPNTHLAESPGGLALNVPAPTLTLSLLETYLRVKERGLL